MVRKKSKPRRFIRPCNPNGGLSPTWAGCLAQSGSDADAILAWRVVMWVDVELVIRRVYTEFLIRGDDEVYAQWLARPMLHRYGFGSMLDVALADVRRQVRPRFAFLPD